MNTRAQTIAMFFLSVFMFLISISANSGKPQKIVDGVYHLTDQNFDQFTRQGVVLVDFWAVWCGPCKVQSPIIDEIALELGQKALIAKVDVDAAKLTAYRYNIRYIPTILIFKDGKPVVRLTGVQYKDTLVKAINNLQ